MSAITAGALASLGSVQLTNITINHSRDSAFQSNAGIAADRDGTKERLIGSIWSTAPGAEWWSLEPISLVGTDYDVKFRRVSGVNPDSKSGWTDDVWTGFISTRHFYSIANNTGSPSTRTAVVEVQVRDKASPFTLRGSMEATLNAILT